MDTGTFSRRRAFRNGSCRDCPLDMARLLVVIKSGPTAFPAPAPLAGQKILTQPTQALSPKKIRNTPENPLGSLRFKGVEPFNPVLSPEPGQLPLRVAPRGNHRSADGFLLSAFPRKMLPQLPVANRAHARQ